MYFYRFSKIASKFKLSQLICRSLRKFQIKWEIFINFLWPSLKFWTLNTPPENYFILECEKSGPKSVVRRRSSRLRILSKRKTIVNFWCHPLFMHFQNTRQHFMKVFSVFVWSGVLGLKRTVSHAQMDARSVIHNAFFCSHTSHRSHHSHTIHWISIVSFNKLWYCHILYCMKNTCVSSIWSVF